MVCKSGFDIDRWFAPAITMCAPAHRGIWLDLLLVMRERGGTGELAGSADELAILSRCAVGELVDALAELKQTGAAIVLRQADEYAVIDKQMQADYASRQAPALRSWISANYGRMFRKLVKRDGPWCRLCFTGDDLQIDHIRPISRGGTNDLRNLQLLCGFCNRKKHAKWEGQDGW